jgi:hypothetical protein
MFDSQNNLIAGSLYQNNFSQEENQKFTSQFDAITQQMIACLDQNLPANSEQMQQAVKQHYEFILRFWAPDRESYKSLAMNYILPTPYKETYEGYREGLGQYIYEAVVDFADRELR